MKKTIKEMKEKLQNVESENVSKKSNQGLKSQNEKLTGAIQQQSKEIEDLKNPYSKGVQVNLPGSNGISSFLKQK
jgi:Sec-independent protein translocase protein TatA